MKLYMSYTEVVNRHIHELYRGYPQNDAQAGRGLEQPPRGEQAKVTLPPLDCSPQRAIARIARIHLFGAIAH